MIPKGLPDFLQCLLVAIRNPESPTNNLSFSGNQRLQDRLGPLPRLDGARHVDRRVRFIIRERVGERAIAVFSELRLERERVLRDVPGLEDGVGVRIRCDVSRRRTRLDG